MRGWATPLVIGVLVPVAVAAGAWAWLQERPITGGLGGCAQVRSFDGRDRCYDERIRAQLAERGRRDGLAAVERAARTDGALATHCHLVLHAAGERAAARTGRMVASVRSLPAGHCTDGYVHGYMLGLQEELTAAQVVESCVTGSRAPASRLRDCAHVFGHQAVRRTDASGLAGALAGCGGVVGTPASRKLVADAELADTCQWGAFMEAAARDDRTASFTTRCAELAGEQRSACHEFLPVAAGMTGATAAEVPAVCERLPAEPDGTACARGVGAAGGPNPPCSRFSGAALRRACSAGAADAA